HKSELFNENQIDVLFGYLAAPPIYLNIYQENDELFFDIFKNLAKNNSVIFTDTHINNFNTLFEKGSQSIFSNTVDLFCNFIEFLDQKELLINDLLLANENISNDKDKRYYNKQILNLII
ncbi:MAG: hypothetical protein WC356_01435, partial [Candidatus Micrarchaeia archaeon]